MERLTTKKIAKELKQNVEATITTTQNISRDIYLRYAEFEDFMEKYNVESMEDLELRLEDIEHYAYNCNVEQIDEIIKLKQENQALKDRWQKLKEYLKENCEYFDQYENMEDCASEYKYTLEQMQELEKE